MRLYLDPDTLARLEILSERTGTPVSTMKEAIADGQMRARKTKGSWYSSQTWHDEWIEGEATETEGRRLHRDPDAEKRLKKISAQENSGFDADLQLVVQEKKRRKRELESSRQKERGATPTTKPAGNHSNIISFPGS